MPWDSTPRILPTLMVKGSLSPGLGGKRGSGQDQGNLVARLEILRTTDDLALAFAVVHPAHRKLVGIGCRSRVTTWATTTPSNRRRV
jgi:hypothetical protein